MSGIGGLAPSSPTPPAPQPPPSLKKQECSLVKVIINWYYLYTLVLITLYVTIKQRNPIHRTSEQLKILLSITK